MDQLEVITFKDIIRVKYLNHIRCHQEVTHYLNYMLWLPIPRSVSDEMDIIYRPHWQTLFPMHRVLVKSALHN